MSTYTVTDIYTGFTINIDSFEQTKDEIRAALLANFEGAPADVVEYVETLAEQMSGGNAVDTEAAYGFLGLRIN